MNIRNHRYMEGTEFKERQGSFEFFCTRAYEFLTTFRDECRAGWREIFRPARRTKAPKQLALNFVRSIANWANWIPEKNLEIFT